MAIADVNGDGIPDLVVVNAGGDVRRLCVGAAEHDDAASGDSILRLSGDLRRRLGPTSLAVADLNGDG